MSERPTLPTDIEGVIGGPDHPWQRRESTWSFEPTEQRLVGSLDSGFSGTVETGSANESSPSTVGPQQILAPGGAPVGIRPRNFGKQSFQPLSQWEGVVERVSASGFFGRLVQLDNGHTSSARIQFTEFAFDDLSNESDRSLVQPGAIFYWTIGRSKNAAGTSTNMSLVRFRRIPSAGPKQRHRAHLEAEDLLKDSEEQSGTGSAKR